MKTIKEILIERDNMSALEAEELISNAYIDLLRRIEYNDPSAFNICEEYFGLESDYMEELIYN